MCRGYSSRLLQLALCMQAYRTAARAPDSSRQDAVASSGVITLPRPQTAGPRPPGPLETGLRAPAGVEQARAGRRRTGAARRREGRARRHRRAGCGAARGERPRITVAAKALHVRPCLSGGGPARLCASLCRLAPARPGWSAPACVARPPFWVGVSRGDGCGSPAAGGRRPLWWARRPSQSPGPGRAFLRATATRPLAVAPPPHTPHAAARWTAHAEVTAPSQEPALCVATAAQRRQPRVRAPCVACAPPLPRDPTEFP
jgi:hypothetical protein